MEGGLYAVLFDVYKNLLKAFLKALAITPPQLIMTCDNTTWSAHAQFPLSQMLVLADTRIHMPKLNKLGSITLLNDKHFKIAINDVKSEGNIFKNE